MASQGDTLHHEYTALSRLGGYGVRRAGVVGILSNAQVIAATSAEDLEAIVEGDLPGTVHSEYELIRLETDLALKRGDAIGDFTDARVAAATGVENLAEATYAGDESDLNHLGPFIV